MTACHTYGKGGLDPFKSRDHCINACALKAFKLRQPGQHAVNIPIFNNSDMSVIAGDAQGYLDLCRETVCRRPDCLRRRFKFYLIRQMFDPEGVVAMIISPQHHIFKFQDVPLTLISDTVLLLSGTLGLWLGISFLANYWNRQKTAQADRRQQASANIGEKSSTIRVDCWVSMESNSGFQQVSGLRDDYAVSSTTRYDVGANQSTFCPAGQILDVFCHIWSRSPETLSWHQHSKSEQYQMVKTYLYLLEMVVTEIRLTNYVSMPEADQLIASGSMRVLKVDVNISKPISVTVIRSFDDVDVNSFFFSLMQLSLDECLVYSFEGLKSNQLPAPYTTDCVNYHSHGYRNRQRCLDSCMEAIFVAKHNTTSSALRPLDMAELTLSTEDFSLMPEANNVKYLHQCQQTCRKLDCEVYVQSSLQSSRDQAGKQAQVVVNAQIQETSIVHFPKMLVSEFILYLGNTFGIWFGFCFLDLVVVLECLKP
ncbi:hypothetical protein HDE_03599 [Halotydeus destructor]|nr:hypothetical protein HDE_03599 [Halotydeus destructor]